MLLSHSGDAALIYPFDWYHCNPTRQILKYSRPFDLNLISLLVICSLDTLDRKYLGWIYLEFMMKRP